MGHVEGWRFSFYIIAALSGLAALLSFLFGSEPRTVVRPPSFFTLSLFLKPRDEQMRIELLFNYGGVYSFGCPPVL